MKRLALALLLTTAVVAFAQFHGKVADPIPVNAILMGGSDGSAIRALKVDATGVPVSAPGTHFRCTVTVSTATTIQAVGGSCVAPGASSSLYITSIQASTSAASGTAADSMPTLKYGTGGTCGSGTTVFWLTLTGANTSVVQTFPDTPIKIPANNELCWIMTTAGTKTFVITGYIAAS
jgi:hypothetical protein